MAQITAPTPANTLRGNGFHNIIDGSVGNDHIYGLGGDDDLDGNRGDDALYGGRGGDDLDGGSGNDRLYGGNGNDILEGSEGNDTLTGGAGADIFEFDHGDGRDTITDFRNGEDRLRLDDFTTAALQSLIGQARQVGSDVVLTLSAGTEITLQNFRLSDLDLSDFVGANPPDITGTEAADTLTGGAGNDDIEGRGGNDHLRGAAGDDEIDGDSGNDRLWGGAGRDDLDGGAGNDRLYGGGGNDTLGGGSGNDTLTGGAGADIFEFERGDGRDTITDFRNGEDRIELDDFSHAQVVAAINGARQVGGNVVLTLSTDTVVTIDNMQLSQLDISDFIL